MEELTGAQIRTFAVYGGDLSLTLPATYDTYRAMRRDPTIALARQLTIAPVIAAEWSVEADEGVPDEITTFIAEQFLPVREPFIESALLGGVDFGWQPFEKVFDLREGRIVLAKLKPLLQDMTVISVVGGSGAFAGFRQHQTVVPLECSLLISFRVEGTSWYGSSLLENARATYNKWVDANDGAARYDKKLAGANVVIKYPPGKTKVNGVMKDNFVIAQDIAAQLESSGTIVVPQTMAEFAEELKLEQLGWSIEVLKDGGGQQPTFVARLKYLDAQKVRALIMPERAILEAEFGTKAEAGVHADLALTHCDLTHRHVTRLMNWHAVNQLVIMNWGRRYENKVRLVAAPLVDEKLAFFRELYKTVVANPAGFMEEYSELDTESLKGALGVPQLKTDEEPVEKDDDVLEAVETVTE